MKDGGTEKRKEGRKEEGMEMKDGWEEGRKTKDGGTKKRKEGEKEDEGRKERR